MHPLLTTILPRVLLMFLWHVSEGIISRILFGLQHTALPAHTSLFTRPSVLLAVQCALLLSGLLDHLHFGRKQTPHISPRVVCMRRDFVGVPHVHKPHLPDHRSIVPALNQQRGVRS